MKKETRNKLIAIFFGLIMLGSTATYALMQAYNFFGVPQQNQATLPTTYIVQGRLSNDVEQLIMSKGGTVVQFYYALSCVNCVGQKNILVSAVNQNQGQIFLEEIQTTNQTAQNIIIESYKDTKYLTDASQSDIQNAFCDVLLQPQPQCALRNFNTS